MGEDLLYKEWCSICKSQTTIDQWSMKQPKSLRARGTVSVKPSCWPRGFNSDKFAAIKGLRTQTALTCRCTSEIQVQQKKAMKCN